jgi:CRISP-associated protein Cas1
MIGRVVEIAQDGRHLSVHRGFMVVEESGNELGRIPLDDIGAVIASAHGLTYSNNFLVALAERNVPFVLSAANHSPVAFLWPVEGHHQQAARMDAQIEATKPMAKRLWQEVVRSKIGHQAAALAYLGRPTAPLESLIPVVKSGDQENIEAQAARRYWGLAFGSEFRRDRSAPGVNALLNYGYMVIRAACARAIMGAGLHPSLGIHHRNANNAMQLVDDLMEPFRPHVDLTVMGLTMDGCQDVNPDAKKVLASVVHADMRTDDGLSPVMGCMSKLATSLGLVYESKRESLDLPKPQRPLEMDIPRLKSQGQTPHDDD